jgi:hypothetical protein
LFPCHCGKADIAAKVLNGRAIMGEELLVKVGKKDQALIDECMSIKPVSFLFLFFFFASVASVIDFVCVRARAERGVPSIRIYCPWALLYHHSGSPVTTDL